MASSIDDLKRAESEIEDQERALREEEAQLRAVGLTGLGDGGPVFVGCERPRRTPRADQYSKSLSFSSSRASSSAWMSAASSDGTTTGRPTRCSLC